MSDSVQKYSASRMGSAPIGPLLLSCSVPMMISMLVQALYNIVDSIFVSRVNEAALSAVSLAFPIQNLMIAFAVGTAVGVNAYLSRCLGVFNASPTMLAMGILALRIIAIHFPMAGFNVISSSAFQALGRGTLALLVSVIRQLVVLVPAAWLLSHTGNVNAVWFAFPIAELVAVTLCAVFMRKCHRDILLPMEAGQKTAAAV